MARRERPAKPGRVLRIIYRVPVLLFRVGGGGLLGHRFLMVVHRGRRSGRLRRTVLEVVHYDPATHESVVAAAYGARSDWYRNLRAAPALEVHTGGHRYIPVQRVLTVEEAEAAFAQYARRHPLLARLIPRLLGIPSDGSPAARRALAVQVPMVAFRPAPAPPASAITAAGGRPASLESLVERLDLGLEVFHPGGLDLTRDLAEQCHVHHDQRVLDVASGTGESACFLEQTLGARVVGIDVSNFMIQRARQKAKRQSLRARFVLADAHALPMADCTFDAAISECTVCILDKSRAIQEMTRVVRSGGYVGIHDLCWQEGVPVRVQEKLLRAEGERPETLRGWRRLFQRAGLVEVVSRDRSILIRPWMKNLRAELGPRRLLQILVLVYRWWGVGGLIRILNSERVFRSRYLGYGVVVGRKP